MWVPILAPPLTGYDLRQTYVAFLSLSLLSCKVGILMQTSYFNDEMKLYGDALLVLLLLPNSLSISKVG